MTGALPAIDTPHPPPLPFSLGWEVEGEKVDGCCEVVVRGVNDT
jgi:hypothetical protein